MPTVLMTAPYMIPFLERFDPVFSRYGIDLIVPEVRERMEEADLLPHAGQFDGAICGDDRYTRRVLEACLPASQGHLQVGDRHRFHRRAGLRRRWASVCTARSMPSPCRWPIRSWVTCWPLPAASPGWTADMKAGKWEKIPGTSLSEQTLGMIGVGNIGKAVTRRARAFGMKVLGNDIVEIDHVFIAETGIQMTDLDALLAHGRFRLRQLRPEPDQFSSHQRRDAWPA